MKVQRLNICGVLGVFLFLSGSMGAQSYYTEEPAVQVMMEEFVRFNKENPLVQGWRIQVLATTERRQMDKVKSRFEYLYPNYELDFEHRNPYYLLKTGAFLNRMEALPLLNKLQKEFPGAFMVSEEVELEMLLQNPKE